MQIASEADFDKYRGKLAGKIVLTQPARQVRMLEGPIILRMDDKWIAEAETTPIPAARGRGARAPRADDDAGGGGRGAAAAFRQKVAEFYRRRGRRRDLRPRQRQRHGRRRQRSLLAAAASRWRHDLSRPAAAPRDANAGKGVPRVTLAVEHYNRMMRVLDKGMPVKVELNVETKFYDETSMNGFNTIAEHARHRSRVKESRAARRALRLASVRDRRHRQRHRQRGDDGSDAHPQGDRREAAAHDSHRAVGRRGTGAARLARLRPRALRRPDTMALKPEHAKLVGLLQLRQRHRPRARHLAAGQPGGAADLRAVDGAAEGSRRRRRSGRVR